MWRLVVSMEYGTIGPSPEPQLPLRWAGCHAWLPHARRASAFWLRNVTGHDHRWKRTQTSPSSSLGYGTNQIKSCADFAVVKYNDDTRRNGTEPTKPRQALGSVTCTSSDPAGLPHPTPRQRSLFAPVWVSRVSWANNNVTRDGITPITLGPCPCTCPCPHASHTAHAVPIFPFACVRCTHLLIICAREHDP